MGGGKKGRGRGYGGSESGEGAFRLQWRGMELGTNTTVEREHVIVYIGAGTNLGDRRTHLTAALDALARLGTIEAVSNVYESEAVGYTDQPDFWNLVVRLRTALAPLDLRVALASAEQRLGRRPTFRNGPRIIDLDILLYGHERVKTAELEVPHPRMMERAFVLRPLAELDPELRHPVTDERFADRLATRTFETAVPIFPGSELLPERTPQRSNVEADVIDEPTTHSSPQRGEARRGP